MRVAKVLQQRNSSICPRHNSHAAERIFVTFIYSFNFILKFRDMMMYFINLFVVLARYRNGKHLIGGPNIINVYSLCTQKWNSFSVGYLKFYGISEFSIKWHTSKLLMFQHVRNTHSQLHLSNFSPQHYIYTNHIYL